MILRSQSAIDSYNLIHFEVFFIASAPNHSPFIDRCDVKRSEEMCRVTGLMQPNVLEMWTKATSFVLGVKSRLNSSTSSFPCTWTWRSKCQSAGTFLCTLHILIYWVIYWMDIHMVFPFAQILSPRQWCQPTSVSLQFFVLPAFEPIRFVASCFKTSKLPSRQCSWDTAKARCWSDVPWPKHVMNYIKFRYIHLWFPP